MVAAEVTDGTRAEVIDHAAYIYHGDQEEKITAIGLAGGASGLRIEIIDKRYAVVHLSASNKEREFTLVMWQGPAGQKNLFEQMLSEKKGALPYFRKGGPAHWKEVVLTRGQLAPDTASLRNRSAYPTYSQSLEPQRQGGGCFVFGRGKGCFGDV
jgi:hypothetical protein